MQNGFRASTPRSESLAWIFRDARGDLSLRAFVEKIGAKKSAYTTLARIERGEVEMPSDEILACISPYTRPYKSVLELKVIALGGAADSTSYNYDEVLAAAQALSNADRVRLIKALVDDLGRV